MKEKFLYLTDTVFFGYLSFLIHFKNYDESLRILTKVEDINKEHYNEDFSSALLQHRGLILSK